MLDGWTWGQVQALYRQLKAHPPVEIVTAAYFNLPPIDDEDEPEEMMSTEDAVNLFMAAGFSAGTQPGM